MHVFWGANGFPRKQKGRLTLGKPIHDWVREALALPGVRGLNMTPEIAIESSQLPGDFHRDPADQIIVATSRIERMPLLTEDSKIQNYPHVTLAI
ncbi:type II toxin-antitoxin system VapC family toxin [bacterium]|nr:MAG: type II toxin-antitoxin system VapC family toxin [bacterium]